MTTNHDLSLPAPQLLGLARECLRRLAGDDHERPKRTSRKGSKAAALILAFLDDTVEFDVELALSDPKSFATPAKSEALDKTLHGFIKTFTAGIDLFSYALDHDHAATVNLILATEGLKVTGTQSLSPDDPQPLLLAAQNGYEAIVKLLLTAPNVNPNIKNQNHQTPLLLASRNGHDAVVKLLLISDIGVELNSMDSDGRTPLWWAARNGHHPAVRLLLTEGADANLKSGDGHHPLLWAARNGHTEVVGDLLATYGVSTDARGSDGRTPLSLAAEAGHEAVARLLLAEGANPDAEDSAGETPLSWAAQNGHEEMVEILLEAEVNPEPSPDWETPGGG